MAPFFIGRKHFFRRKGWARTFFIGRKHFSASANIFHRPQTFFFRRNGWARTFFIGRKHFHLSARIWRKVFKVRLFSKQSVQGAKQSPKGGRRGRYEAQRVKEEFHVITYDLTASASHLLVSAVPRIRITVSKSPFLIRVEKYMCCHTMSPGSHVSWYK